MDDTILGHDFLVHWNPDVNWREGVINLRTSTHQSTTSPLVNQELNSLPDSVIKLDDTSFPPGDLQYPDSLIPSSNDHGVIAYCSNLPIQSFFEEKEPLSLRGFLYSMVLSHPPSKDTFEEDEDIEDKETIFSTLPEALHAYADVFSHSKADQLPPHRPYDHQIELSGPVPPPGPIYSLSKQEASELRDYIAENVAKGFLRPSKSNTGSPVLFVPKKDGTLRLCVDYRKLNNVTRRNAYPVPPMSHLLTLFHGATLFSKLDLRGAYNLIRIAEGHEYLTAMRTRFGSFEYTVMPFGLCNAPSTFQSFVNDIFSDLVEECLVVYLDDILVYSKTFEDHTRHLEEVLQRLRHNHLYAKLSKCEFYKTSLPFLGVTLSIDGIQMDPSKCQKILDWPQPTNLKALQSFLGFANFYRKFIKDYSKTIVNLTALSRKDIPFVFTHQAIFEFENLKKAFTTAPILAHFSELLRTILETDASDYAIAGVISQYSSKNLLHPVAFESRKLQSAELNYEIHDKELLAIVYCLKKWRSYLLSVSHPFEVLTDHSSLKYFMSTKVLTRRQARWAEFLSEFNFKIVYRPGKLAVVPDALSRRDDVYPSGGKAFADNNPNNVQALFSENHVQLDSIHLGDLHSKYLKLRDAQSNDPYCLEIRSKLANTTASDSKRYSTNSDGILLFEGRIVVPNHPRIKLDIFESRHDSPLAGHFGQDKTYQLIARDFYWPGMTKEVKDYVNRCFNCNRNKSSNHRKYGLLQSLPIPPIPWHSISMDFISQLPLSDGYDAILVVVDRFSKMSLFLRTNITSTSEDLATLFIEHVFSKHGLPDNIISDRGTLFVSSFWTSLCQHLKITRNLSTAYHPETDGQTERVNQILEQYLRMFVNYQQDDWSKWLPLAEFAYNNATHSSTHQSPFQTIYGRHLSFEAIHLSPSTPAADYLSSIQHLQAQLKVNLEAANQRYQVQANKSRLETPQFKVGDKVWLDARNIRSTRPTKKLSEKKLGPFTIEAEISKNAFKLSLPSKWKAIHPVFHVSLLEPARDLYPGKAYPPPEPVNVQDHLEWEVNRILDSRIRKGKLQYLVEWTGYQSDEDRTSWEPAHHLRNSPDLVRNFHISYPLKPSQPS